MFYKKDNLVINPSNRREYKKIEGFPEVVIIGHSTRWPQILSSVSKDDPNIVVLQHTLTRYEESVLFAAYGKLIKYIFASEGSLALHTTMVKAYFNGAKYIINIGCAGGLKEDLKVGDLVICNEVVRDSGFGNLLATDDERAVCSTRLSELLLNGASKLGNTVKDFPKSRVGKVWCVNSLYYSEEQVDSARQKGCDIVEMEVETGAITMGWLNENYFKENPVEFAQISYISDMLQGCNGPWCDVFASDKTEEMVIGKRDALLATLEALKGL